MKSLILDRYPETSTLELGIAAQTHIRSHSYSQTRNFQYQESHWEWDTSPPPGWNVNGEAVGNWSSHRFCVWVEYDSLSYACQFVTVNETSAMAVILTISMAWYWYDNNIE